MSDITIIIPTLNESENILKTLDTIIGVFNSAHIDGEILVVDDCSTDGTIDKVIEYHKLHPNVFITIRHENHGLAQSVVDGFGYANSDILLVTDAGGSHELEIIPQMYQLVKNGADIIVGSRYTKGGEIKDWPIKRRLIPIGATGLARILNPTITDPVSGFFAVRKEVVKEAPLRGGGFKILFDILTICKYKNVIEIPFTFKDRSEGKSKMGYVQIKEYIKQFIKLFYYKYGELIRFGTVGVSGIFVNEGILILLKEFFGYPLAIASIIAMELSILTNFALNNKWTFNYDTGKSIWYRLCAYHGVTIIGATINFAALIALSNYIDYRIANLIGIVIAFGWNYSAHKLVTFNIG